MLPVDPRDGSLDLADLERVLAAGNVSWVALTGASNLTGFAPDLRAASTMSHAAGARLHVDAVARAPHLPIDVDGWGIDSLVTSPYKWYGPHAGILVLQPDLLHGVEPYRVRPADYPGPERWETGTLAFEAVAGIGGAAAFMAEHPWDVVTRPRPRSSTGWRPVCARCRASPCTHRCRRRGARRRRSSPSKGANRNGSRARWPNGASRCGAATTTRVSWSTRSGCAAAGVVRAGVVRHTTVDDVDALLARSQSSSNRKKKFRFRREPRARARSRRPDRSTTR